MEGMLYCVVDSNGRMGPGLYRSPLCPITSDYAEKKERVVEIAYTGSTPTKYVWVCWSSDKRTILWAHEMNEAATNEPPGTNGTCTILDGNPDPWAR